MSARDHPSHAPGRSPDGPESVETADRVARALTDDDGALTVILLASIDARLARLEAESLGVLDRVRPWLDRVPDLLDRAGDLLGALSSFRAVRKRL